MTLARRCWPRPGSSPPLAEPTYVELTNTDSGPLARTDADSRAAPTGSVTSRTRGRGHRGSTPPTVASAVGGTTRTGCGGPCTSATAVGLLPVGPGHLPARSCPPSSMASTKRRRTSRTVRPSGPGSCPELGWRPADWAPPPCAAGTPSPAPASPCLPCAPGSCRWPQLAYPMWKAPRLGWLNLAG
jgi:hypothetical protein